MFCVGAAHKRGADQVTETDNSLLQMVKMEVAGKTQNVNWILSSNI